MIERTNELVIKNKKPSDYTFLNAHNLRAPVANIKGVIQLFDINLRLKEDTLIDHQEKEEILNQSTNSSSSSSSSSS